MNGITDGRSDGYGPWRRYITQEHAARAAYLATVQHAHHEYLTGPWPDRDAYQHVEQSAWMTYYAAGREAWHTYRSEIETPPPPPPLDFTSAAYTSRPGVGWPDSPPASDRPTFTPSDGGADQWLSS